MDLYFAWQQWHRERTSVSEETVIRDADITARGAWQLIEKQERPLKSIYIHSVQLTKTIQ